MTLETVLQRLGLEAHRAAIEPGWPDSAAALPAALPFLQDGFIRDISAYMELGPPITAELIRVGARLETDETLRALAGHAHGRQYGKGPSIGNWPAVIPALGADTGLFYLLILLSRGPALRADQEARAIPRDIVADTLSDIPRHAERYRLRNGIWGLDPLYAGGWLRNHLMGTLYRLGRLQFMPARFPKVPCPVALNAGDPVLDIHIPEIGPMPPEACAESIRRAKTFFPRYFPKNPEPLACVCTSWLLDPQLAAWLDPQSNILSFQRLFHLFPVESDAWSAFRFVFDLDIPYGTESAPDLTRLSRRTRLERALIAHVEAGGRWRKDGGFRLLSDSPESEQKPA